MKGLPEVKSLSGDDWAAMVSQASHPLEGSGNGRKFLYLNSQKQVQLFESDSAAKSAGFKKRMPLKEINKFTKEKMRSISEGNKLKVATTLHQLSRGQTYRIEDRTLKEGAVKKFFRSQTTPSAVALETTSLSKAFDLKIGTGTPQEKLEYFRACLKKPDSIQRSKGGKQGGVFYVQSEHGRPVIKFEKHPECIVIADNILERMGFVTPRSFVVSRQDPIGEAAIGTFTGTTISWPNEKYQKPMFDRQINDPEQQFICMDLVDAQDFADLAVPQLEEILGDDEIVQSLGQLALLDAFMGNTDRLSTKKFNPENVMILAPPMDKEEGPPTKKLAVIDSLFDIFTEEDAQLCKEELELLFSKKGLANLSASLLGFTASRLGPTHKLFSEKSWGRVQENLQIGIKQGALMLLEAFPDKYQYRMMVEDLAIPGKAEVSGFQTASMLELLKTLVTR